MNEIRLLLRLAKMVRTPQQAAVLVVVSGTLIAVIYLTPAETVERLF